MPATTEILPILPGPEDYHAFRCARCGSIQVAVEVEQAEKGQVVRLVCDTCGNYRTFSKVLLEG